MQAVSRKVEAIEPRETPPPMVDGVVARQNTTRFLTAEREKGSASAGSESMACTEVSFVNVGDPSAPAGSSISSTSLKSEELKWVDGNQRAHSTLRTGEPATWGRGRGNIAFCKETVHDAAKSSKPDNKITKDSGAIFGRPFV